MRDTGRVTVATQARLWQWAAVAYVIGASLFFAFMPILALPGQDGKPVWVAPYRIAGWAVFLPLLIPLVLTLIPVLVPGRRVRLAWICVGILTALCLYLALSSGLIFLPAPVLAAFGAYLTMRAPIEDAELVDEPWRVPEA